MTSTLSEYRTIVFDCDGVILNSNRVKTEAFYRTALPYGEAAAQQLVDYHVNNGGISRYRKFTLLLDEMVDHSEGPPLEALLETYASQFREGLMACEIAEGLRELRKATPDAQWLVASGGDQQELREIFNARGIADYFDGGIFGSPDTKDHILSRELGNDSSLQPGILLGDSTYDHAAATAAGLDFIFISGWTEVPGWREWSDERDIEVVTSLSLLTV